MENFCPEISKRRNEASIQSQFDSLLSDLTTTPFARRCVRLRGGRRLLRQVSRHLLQQPDCLSAGVQLTAAFWCFSSPFFYCEIEFFLL